MTKKSTVPNGIGNKATLPPTATKSPHPQVKLVLAVAPGAVAPGAKKGGYSLLIIRQPLIHKLRVGLIVFISRLMENPFRSA
ncbi:hypothetical protein V6N12_042301 [Hibiscus sabdariffa]|uniref:Uncharacterized protein n=1 Tax=Hibiscus sabdariffa TaxID=183260 RepID=A0ABR2EED7_9ROSI